MAIVITLAAFGCFLVAYATSAAARVRAPLGFVEAAGFVMIVTSLVYGGLVYLFARLGYMRRRDAFRHALRDEMQQFAANSDASLAILVPSYKEEPRIIRQTLLSAALQEYPELPARVPAKHPDTATLTRLRRWARASDRTRKRSR